MRSRAAFITFMLRLASVNTALAFASPRAATAMTTAAADVCPAMVALEDHSPSYKLLLDKLRTIAHLNNAASVLNYDRQVFMPSKSDKASAARGRQLAALATISHEMSTDPRIGTLIEDATRDLAAIGLPKSGEDGVGSLGTAKRILELEGEAYKKRVCIPAELAARKAELEAAANHAWVKVRAVCSTITGSFCLHRAWTEGHRRCHSSRIILSALIAYIEPLTVVETTGASE